MPQLVGLLSLIIGSLLSVGLLIFTKPWELFNSQLKPADLTVFILITPFVLIGVILILLGLKNLFGLFIIKKYCQVCAKLAYDKLSNDQELGYYCRTHLIQRYSELLAKNPFSFVMLEFQPEGLNFAGYLYYPLSEIDWGGNQQEIIKFLLDSIKSKNCQKCDNSAAVLFIPKEVAPFKKNGPEPQRDFVQKGEYLCRKHLLERIIPSIQKTSRYFNLKEGLNVPFKEDGYQATVEF